MLFLNYKRAKSTNTVINISKESSGAIIFLFLSRRFVFLRTLMRSCPIKVVFSADATEPIISERLSGGRQRAPAQFLEIVGNDLDWGKIGVVFSINVGAAAQNDMVNVAGEAQEGGDNSGLLSIQGYKVVPSADLARPPQFSCHNYKPFLLSNNKVYLS